MKRRTTNFPKLSTPAPAAAHAIHRIIFHNHVRRNNKSPPAGGPNHHRRLSPRPLRPLRSNLFFLLLFLFPVSCILSPAHASCFNPAGNAGQMMYNADWHVPQYCNGGAWLWMGTPGVPLSIQNGLVGYWKLDDGSGTSAADSTGNGNTGTLAPSSTWITGKINGAASVDGTSQHIDVAASSTLNDLSSFTYSAWIKPALGTFQCCAPIVEKGSGSDTKKSFNVDESGSSADLSIHGFIQTSGTNASCATSSNTLTRNVWQHVTMTYDDTGSRKCTIYLNGVNVTNGQTAATGTLVADAGYAISFGATPATQFFKYAGGIDDVRIYNRVLTSAEITGLANWTVVTPGPAVPTLLGWWKFDESSGTSAADSSGNGNTGTLTAANASFVAGHINNAVSLTHTGTNASGLVTAANPSNFSFEYNQPFTLAAWIYRNVNTEEDDLFGKEDPTNSLYRGYGLWFTDTSNSNSCTTGYSCLVAEVTNASVGNGNLLAQVSSAGNAVSLGAWHHVVMTYDGSHTAAGIKMYLDGSALTTTTKYDLLGTNTIVNTKPLQIGGDGDGDGATDNGCYTFGGKIDDARVYNGVLTASQVAQLYSGSSPTAGGTCSGPAGNEGDLIYNAGSNHVEQFCGGSGWVRMGKVPGAGGAGCANPAGSEGNIIYNKDYYALQYCDGTNWVVMGNRALTGLVGWWNFDEGSGTSAADSSGNNNTGTLVNTPTWVSGKINGALTFNGTNQYVQTTSPFSIGSVNFTVVAWVNGTASGATLPVLMQQSSGAGTVQWELTAGNGLVNFESDGPVAWLSTHAPWVTPNITMPSSQWNQIAVVGTSTSTSLYVNGALMGTASLAAFDNWPWGRCAA